MSNPKAIYFRVARAADPDTLEAIRRIAGTSRSADRRVLLNHIEWQKEEITRLRLGIVAAAPADDTGELRERRALIGGKQG